MQPTFALSASTPPAGRSGRRRRWIPAALTAGMIVAATVAGCDPPPVPPVTPVTPVFAANAGIEGVPQNESAASPCDPVNSFDKAGPIALRGLLAATYGSIPAGITRACDGSVSEHHEGRSLDWMADYADPALRPKALAVIDWLRATDDHGNTNAVARRLGIQYWIYNKQIYGSWNDFAPSAYSCAGDPTSCHVNHIHFSFTWAGAYKQTSFWRGTPLPTATAPGASFAVDSRNPAPALAPVTLAGGRTYVVEASGTYAFGPIPGQVADAECSVTTGTTWSTTRPTTSPYGSEVLDVKLVGGGFGGSAWTPVVNTGGGCNTSDHRYRMTVRSWSPVVLSGLVLDGRTDNSGLINVRVVSVS